jgi:hypothetical protein
MSIEGIGKSVSDVTSKATRIAEQAVERTVEAVERIAEPVREAVGQGLLAVQDSFEDASQALNQAKQYAYYGGGTGTATAPNGTTPGGTSRIDEYARLSDREFYQRLDYDPNGPSEEMNAIRRALSVPTVMQVRDEAFRVTQQEFPTGRNWNDEGDAFRHAYLSYRLTQELGPDVAKAFTDAHEVSGGNAVGEMKMDLYNNEIGRLLAQDPANAGRDPATVIREALGNGLLRTSPFPSNP